jgi:hypothetical protein
MAINSTLKQAYEFVTDDEEGEVCDSLPDEACQEVPRNFFLNVANGMATKLADQLANPGLVLPWFLDALGAPAAVIGFLTPVRRAGALLPQLAVAGQIRRFPIRKWFWLAGGAGFGLALILMAPAALLFSGLSAGILIVVLLGFGSLSRGVSSVAFKDVLAKTIPRGQRGTLLALRATLGGGLALIAGVILKLQVDVNSSALTLFLVLILMAGGLWILGVSVITLVVEEPGATDGGRNPLEEARAGIRLYRKTPGLRQFILTRSALLGIELSLPFYALMARRSTGGGAGDLGVFVIAASLAQVLSSPLWGRLADRASRLVMAGSGALAALAGFLSLTLGTVGLGGNIYAYGLVVMLVGFAIAGVRLGRKTYLVDGAPERERPLYVALTNTVLGVLTILGSGMGFIADVFGLDTLIALLAGLAAISALASLRLPKTDKLSLAE